MGRAIPRESSAELFSALPCMPAASAPDKSLSPVISPARLLGAIIGLTLTLLLLCLMQVLVPELLGPAGFLTAAGFTGLLLIGVGLLWFFSDKSAHFAHIQTAHQNTCQALASARKEHRQLTRRYREEKLRAEAASRSKTAFLAHISHDVRTPLNHIIGFADLIGHQAFGPVGDKRYLSYVEDIKRSGERLLFSFAEILELAELDAGKRVLQNETILVDDLLNSLHEQFLSNARHCGIVLEVNGPVGIELRGDRNCLLRMLANLLDNSMRFTSSGGKVCLSAWQAQDGVVFCVTDTGIGISKERMAALSAPFSLDDATLARDKGGLGLGLAISRSIAELSGGELVIDSTPAIGTTVAISLPTRLSDEAVKSAA